MQKVIIIAEAGVNHNGSIELAKKLIEAAAEAGADYVKFQTFKAEKIVSKFAKKADYQVKNTGNEDDTQLKMLKTLELKEKDHATLIEHCAKHQIKFLSTGFDLESIEFLSKQGITLAKIPSGEITNLPYLRKIAELFSEVIISTGMATLEEIADAIDVLERGGVTRENITVLHCTTEYPAPMKDVNLKAMVQIQKYFNVSIGYSDHTEGIEVPVAAVALGATIIEKHFTLDKNMPGPDHKASLEPGELDRMVSAIRNIELAISGTGVKAPTDIELKNIVIVRKSIVAARNIKKGEIFSLDNIGAKRPGNGISPMQWDKVIGATALRDFSEDELIEL